MNVGIQPASAATAVAGWSVISAAIGFVAVFAYLATRFNYPAVLDGSAANVLPSLLELGATGRAVWAFYALLPLLLIPAGIGAHAALSQAAPNAMRAAVVLATLAAFAMFLGLARWPSVHWELAHAYPGASPDGRVAIAAVFAGLNVYLGNYVGEFAGEIALNGFFVLTGFAALRSAQVGRWFGMAGIAVGIAGWIGAFRNVTAAVDPIATANNYLLAVWLIVLGIVLVRWPAASSSANLRGASDQVEGGTSPRSRM